MAIADWSSQVISLARSFFGSPVFFTAPLQVSGPSKITPPYTIVGYPSDVYGDDTGTMTREFTIQHWVRRSDEDDSSRVLDAAALVDGFTIHISSLPRGRMAFAGGSPLRVVSVESPEIAGADDNLFVIEITLEQELEVD